MDFAVSSFQSTGTRRWSQEQVSLYIVNPSECGSQGRMAVELWRHDSLIPGLGLHSWFRDSQDYIMNQKKLRDCLPFCREQGIAADRGTLCKVHCLLFLQLTSFSCSCIKRTIGQASSSDSGTLTPNTLRCYKHPISVYIGNSSQSFTNGR